MKRLLIFVLLAVVAALSQTTPNLGLNLPTPGGDIGIWGGLLNANSNILDAKLACFGTATTPGTLTYFNGTSWICIAGNSSSLQVLQENSVGVPTWAANAGAIWGSITGVLSNQTDLQSALNLKAPLVSPTFTGTVTLPITGSTQCLQVNTLGVLSGTGCPVWGSITGTLSAQTDLQNALNLKAPLASPSFTGMITVGGSTAGFFGIGQGTAQGLGTNTIGLTGPTSITSYNLVFPSTAGNGCIAWANSSNIVSGSFVTGCGGNFAEQSAPSGIASSDLLWGDSSAHRLKTNPNNGGATTLAEFTDNLGVFANGGTITPALYATATNCSVAGSAASPSLVACSAAPSGAFSCATDASGATCVVSTTAVTANSDIHITPTASASTRLSVTCNTTVDAPTAPRIASISTGVSFTINLGTFSVNPECYFYDIVN